MAMSASDARKNLFPLIEQVNNDAVAVEITSRKGNAVLVSASEWAAIQETAYLLRSPRNAARLVSAIEKAEAGAHTRRELAAEA